MSETNADQKSVPCSEMVTSSARLSPYEDFKLRSLPALKGLWSKLLYIAELRTPQGKYEHWGHSRTYGEQQSQDALRQIHSELYIEVLRTPLRKLIPSEAEKLERLAAEISAAGERLVPENEMGGSQAHFNSIVLAVRLLGDARSVSSHPAA